MIINKRTEGSKLTIHIEGRLDTATSPELSKELETALNGVTELVFDLCKEYDWIPISMKNDWSTIYGDGVTKK